MRPVLLSLLALAVSGRVFSAAPVIETMPGFTVEQIYSVPGESQGSWVALVADRQGGLYASDQYGPVYQVTLRASPEERAAARALPLPVGGVHGFAWRGDDLYAVGGEKAAAAPGLSRLRDEDRDGVIDAAQLLRALDGDGEHGPHAVVVAPDGQSLYVMGGNGSQRPELARSRVPPFWGEDALLPPLPAFVGSETRGHLGGGWIARTDIEGRSWELVAGGFRNAYALAIDADGELFTFDSDTEFEINLPWYRPTRVLHVVSGADFGWRRGRYKVPETALDGWPALLPLGLGSPTAVLIPAEAILPERYRRALWVADWSYGKLYAVHLETRGATFTGTAETIVSGAPLPITAVCVNPVDGALYFATGGRRTQSALYRLTWSGLAPGESVTPRPVPPEVAQRRALEAFHGREDPDGLRLAWPALASTDPFVRRAARVVLESQPVATWRDGALNEERPRIALAALLALARVDAKSSQEEILDALHARISAGLPSDLRPEALRVLTLAITRGGELPEPARARWVAAIDRLYPPGMPGPDPLLTEMRVRLDAPDALARGFALLQAASSREMQLDLARSLRARHQTWNADQRGAYIAWLGQTAGWKGGASFNLLLKLLRDEALAFAAPAERAALESALAAGAAPSVPVAERREFVRNWTVGELIELEERSSGPRDLARGKRAFGIAGCYACHSFAGEGGALGPDLTGVTARMATADLLEAIVNPSREISDQYGTVEVTLRNGRRHSGRIVNHNTSGMSLAENLLDPSQPLRIPAEEIASIEESRVSLMPPGLINGLAGEEVLDLLAFLRTGMTSADLR